MENIKEQILNNYLNQQLMAPEEVQQVNNTNNTISVPNQNELDEFKNYVKMWIEVDNNVKQMLQVIKERKVIKQEISKKIIQFMSHYNIEDLNTKDGKLRYKVTTVKTPLSQNTIKTNLLNNYQVGIPVEELTDKVFQRDIVSKGVLKRFK